MSFFLLLNTKEDILKNDWNFDFHSIFFLFYYGSQWCQTTVWFPSVFKIFIYVQLKKETHTGLQQLEGE